MTEVYIHGIGHFHPENVISNKFLEELDIGTNDSWIMDRVGIRERRTVLPLDYIRDTKNKDIRAAMEAAAYDNTATSKIAAENALQQAGLSPQDIGMVICGSCSPDITTPAQACTIAASMAIEAPAVDLNSACSSFGAQLHFVSMLEAAQAPPYILLVLPENNTRCIDYSDRANAVLWGDGTAAIIVSRSVKSKVKITNTALSSNPKSWHKVQIPRFSYFQQDGHAVQTFAIKTTTKCYKELAGLYKGSDGQLYFIGHQANLTMLQSVCKRCNIENEQHLYNIDLYGNTGAAGAPIVLSQNWDRIEPGATIALVVVGAGLTWSRLLIEFS